MTAPVYRRGTVIAEKWKLEKYLGEGSFGKVFKAFVLQRPGTSDIDAEHVAVKCVDAKNMNSSARDDLMTEIKVMKTLSHPHIVKLIDFDCKGSTVYIVMEFCDGGDLAKLIKEHGCLLENVVVEFLKQLASALDYLDKAGVAHLDLKPSNILLEKQRGQPSIVKLADFGYASISKGSNKSSSGDKLRGSPLYMAPEIVLHRQFDGRCDLWSVGVILHECIYGYAPFHSTSYDALIAKLVSTDPVELPKEPVVSSSCRHLLNGLLQRDPKNRTTLNQLCKHKFLSTHSVAIGKSKSTGQPQSRAKSLGNRPTQVISSPNISKPIRAISAPVAHPPSAAQCQAVINAAFLAQAREQDLKAYSLYVAGVDLIVEANSRAINSEQRNELQPLIDKSQHVYMQQAEEIKKRQSALDSQQHAIRKDVASKLEGTLPSKELEKLGNGIRKIGVASAVELSGDTATAFATLQQGVEMVMSVVKESGTAIPAAARAFLKADIAQLVARLEQLKEAQDVLTDTRKPDTSTWGYFSSLTNRIL